jgi:CHAD domain-containing protein
MDIRAYGDEDLKFGRSGLEAKSSALHPELVRVKRHPSADAIHDARVQSRRFRAALEAFRDLCLTREWRTVYDSVRAVTKTLGGVRESEVLLNLLSQIDGDATPAAAVCREYLQERLERKVRKLKKKLGKELRQLKVKRLRVQTRSLLSSMRTPRKEPVSGLHERFGRITRALAEPVLDFDPVHSFARAGDSRLHRLRIAVKKLRYGLEIFDELHAGGLQPLIAACRAMQDAAGLHQDWAVLREFLRREGRRLTRQKRTNLAAETCKLLDSVEERKRELRRRILPALAAVQSGTRELLAPEIPPAGPSTAAVEGEGQV